MQCLIESHAGDIEIGAPCAARKVVPNLNIGDQLVACWIAQRGLRGDAVVDQGQLGIARQQGFEPRGRFAIAQHEAAVVEQEPPIGKTPFAAGFLQIERDRRQRDIGTGESPRQWASQARLQIG